MNDPAPVSRPPVPPGTGSLLLGFGIAWGVVIVGYIIVAVLIGAMSGASDAGLIPLLMLPLLALLGLIVWFAVQGKSRTAIGIVIGAVSIIAVCLLLVAACFSLLAGSFH